MIERILDKWINDGLLYRWMNEGILDRWINKRMNTDRWMIKRRLDRYVYE